ncbi:MAG: DNA polymerase II large subunit, partial [Candidatus Methanomethylophilaceae archaeon]|nr:DNA polymerase II large subunit [Candidatus Methanomethylophilaceae archaeon]
EGLSREKALDRAIRVGLAVLTEGILVAPLEGIADTKIKQNDDGTEFVDLVFAGPIRAAGGTAQAMSVLLADIVRVQLGIGKYKPTEGEINRFLEEIPLYKQCQHIQYSPSNEEIKLIAGRCPIMIDGEGTEKMEISGFRDLPRISTNQVRGGACLVVAEGMCLKAAKLQKHVKKLNMEGWEFMDEYLAMKGAAVATSKDEVRSVHPSDKYLKDIVAGRPIFGHPSRVGGFRLRYGRARTSGLASLAFSPASTYILDEFPALGTQLKIERPGKACVVTPCDQLDGPIVVLKNGDLVQCQTSEEAQGLTGRVAEITDNGEVLVPFGEFCENTHFLVPCGYPIEWHVQELEGYYEKQTEAAIGAELKAKAEAEIRAKIDKIEDPEKKEKNLKSFDSDVSELYMKMLRKEADAHSKLPEDWEMPTWERCKEMSHTMAVPMHPYYNLFWSDVSLDNVKGLRRFVLENGRFAEDTLIIPKEPMTKRVLEDLGALHKVRDGEVVIDTRYGLPVIECLGLSHEGEKITEVRDLEGDTALSAVSFALGIEVRARAVTRIVMRMGRPEKAKDRKGSPIVHGLFPIKTEATTTKNVIEAIETLRNNTSSSKRMLDLVMCPRVCPVCGATTFRTWCRQCNAHTEANVKKDSEGKYASVREPMKVDIIGEYEAACKKLGSNGVSELKVMDELISRLKVPEDLEKAILRQKYDLGVYKDGTIRFDMSDIPTTHFKPREIGLSIEKAHELGYTHDWNYQPLTDPEQIVEIKPQDFIPNVECGKYMLAVAQFIDEMLEKLYGMERFYNCEKKEDLIGQMFIALAPHTSGGILCRMIGYTTASGCYAHPYFHAAKRRNCDGDEDCVMLLLDGLINF